MLTCAHSQATSTSSRPKRVRRLLLAFDIRVPKANHRPPSPDIRNWKTNYNVSAGCTDSEINAFDAQLNPPTDSGHKKLVDVWRHLHPDLEGHYTYFSCVCLYLIPEALLTHQTAATGSNAASRESGGVSISLS